ncbi:hypothetical protein [Metaclostridioides mangenotii]|uniref:Phage protein n=1 Tax=Metaclostridioides mangenotii TaxID=1540 RepID=A0ABS4E937_9FIRM|nr:hypothetical protein [Clostridioides mangenotii]MBP1854428.1 hypothetical protein [Clostridioides mangenotii]
MIYIKIDNNNTVTTQHFYPFDIELGYGKTEEELLKTGFLVETIPEGENIPGKETILKYDKESNSFYFEYEDIPKNEEESLKDKIKVLEKQVADLYFMQLQGGTN